MKIKDYLNEVLELAIAKQVSDIHFTPQKDSVQIAFRIFDKLETNSNIKLDTYTRVLRYVKFRCKLDPSICNRPQDGSFMFVTQNLTYHMRISTINLLYSESLVIRIIYTGNINNDLSATNINVLLELYDYFKNNQGIYIFTGPTGSGKTTAMYFLLNKLCREEQKKVITIENPVEIVSDNFTQIQVDEELKLDYNICLKSALRQDPDVIMIGEIRDATTARNVFRAGLTGHCVITTMHTRDKYGVIERLYDFGFYESEIKSVLLGISNQRLVRTNKEIFAKFDIIFGEQLKTMIESKGENEEKVF